MSITEAKVLDIEPEIVESEGEDDAASDDSDGSDSSDESSD